MSKKIAQPKQPRTFTRIEKTFFGIALLFLLLHVAAPMLHPEYVFWGFNATKYLPSWSVVVPITGIIALSIAFFFPPKDNAKLLIAKKQRVRYAILGAFVLAVILAANIDAFVLGDGDNILVKIIASTRGVRVTERAPLSFLLFKAFYYVIDILRPHAPSDSMNLIADTINITLRERAVAELSFTVVGILLVVVLIVYSMKISRQFFQTTSLQFLSTLFVIASGFIVLFAGYVELYALPIVLNLLFHYSVLRCLEGKYNPIIPTVLLLVTILSHFGMIIYLPTLIVTLWFAYKKSWHKVALMGIAFGAAIVVALSLLDYSIGEILQRDILGSTDSNSHLLPFFEVTKSNQIYTALSLLHLSDLVNWFMLINPFVLLLIVFSMRKISALNEHDTRNVIVLGISAVVSLGMIVLFNCDISMVMDWDLLTPYIMPIILLSLLLLSKTKAPKSATTMLRLCVYPLLAHASLWLWTLASDSASIARAKSLLNPQTYSDDGLYVSTGHLAKYYGEKGMIPDVLQVWERLTRELSPDDSRAYFTLARMYDRNDKYEKAKTTLHTAIERNIADYRIHGLYAEHLFAQQRFQEAIPHFENYYQNAPRIGIDSVLTSTMFRKLGWCFFHEKQEGRFISTVERALQYNGGNAEASMMLGEYYVQQGRCDAALPSLDNILATSKDLRFTTRARELKHICDQRQ